MKRVAVAGPGQEQFEFERLATQVSFPRCQIRLFHKHPERRDQGQEGHGNKGSILELTLHPPGVSHSSARCQQQ